MADDPQTESPTRRPQATEGAEMRTIGFRLRELQRLMALRVEQENRRLEAEGLDPVTEPRFHDPMRPSIAPEEE